MILTGLRDFLAYSGARDDKLGRDDKPLNYLADALLLGLLGIMVYRNTVLYPHWIAWLLGGTLVAHVTLLAAHPARLNHWRVVVVGVAAVVIAMVLPIRMGENVFITSFLACLGCMALFFVRGSLTAIGAGLAYITYVGSMLQLPVHGFHDPRYNVMMIAGLTIVILVALLFLHHFMVRLEQSNHQLQQSSDYLQQAIDGLHYAAAAGTVGIWNFRPDEDRWNANDIFRELLDLPARDYPEINSDLVRQRLAPESADTFIERMRTPGDSEFELIDILRPDGTRVPCQIMSKAYQSHGESLLRRGVLVEVSQ